MYRWVAVEQKDKETEDSIRKGQMKSEQCDPQ